MTIETCKRLAEHFREQGDEETALEYEARIDKKLKKPKYSSYKREDFIKAKPKATSTTKTSEAK